MKQQGTTLIETVLVVSISVLLLGALFTLYDWHTKIYLYEEGVVRTSGSARLAMQSIEDYGLQGYRVVAAHTFGSTMRATDANAVVIKLPAIDGSHSVLNNTWDYAAFTKVGATLIMDIDADGSSSRKDLTKTLSDTVTNFTLTYDNPDYELVKKITADLAVQLQIRSQLVSDHLTEDIVLRNH